MSTFHSTGVHRETFSRAMQTSRAAPLTGGSIGSWSFASSWVCHNKLCTPAFVQGSVCLLGTWTADVGRFLTQTLSSIRRYFMRGCFAGPRKENQSEWSPEQNQAVSLTLCLQFWGPTFSERDIFSVCLSAWSYFDQVSNLCCWKAYYCICQAYQSGWTTLHLGRRASSLSGKKELNSFFHLTRNNLCLSLSVSQQSPAGFHKSTSNFALDSLAQNPDGWNSAAEMIVPLTDSPNARSTVMNGVAVYLLM